MAEIGLSLVILSLVFACAALIRRWSRPLRKLFIPTAVIGGFLVMGLGGMAIDGVIICAVGTLSLGAIGANVAFHS